MATQLYEERRCKTTSTDNREPGSFHLSRQPSSSIHDSKETPRILTSCSDKHLAYRIPLLSLLPPLARKNDELDNEAEELTWSCAYKSARSFLLETQKERQQSKEKRIRKTLRGPKTAGEISLQIGRLENAGKKVSSKCEKLQEGLNYELHGHRPAGWWDYAHGISSGQWIYPSRPPNTSKTSPRGYLPQRRTTEKTTRKNFEVLKPWEVKKSKLEEKQCEIITVNETCCAQIPEKFSPKCQIERTIYLPHHR